MFTVTIETQFLASHQLLFADGSREPLHQHNWVVTAAVSSTKLDSTGLVIDFHLLKAMLEEITAPFDNTNLRQNDYFQQNSCSAEMLSKYIFEKLSPKLPPLVKLQSIKIVEAQGCTAKFSK